jgi:hypothetical protein
MGVGRPVLECRVCVLSLQFDHLSWWRSQVCHPRRMKHNQRGPWLAVGPKIVDGNRLRADALKVTFLYLGTCPNASQHG